MIATAPEISELQFLARESRTRQSRTLEEFAVEEIVLPTGPYANQRLRIDRQPFLELLYAEFASGRWSRAFVTGCVQSGKSLGAYVIPTLYHLFEIGEDVILGLPDLNMANDKWTRDFVPVIEKSRYAHLVPSEGPGSRGGKVVSVKFKNGAELRFMSGGAGDKGRASYTSRVVALTEVDGMDKAKETSEETDPISQIEARTKAFQNRMIYGECTLTTKFGRTYREIKGGSDSRIALPCIYCKAYVTPEREHFAGWEDAIDELEAEDKAVWHCPACGAKWSEDDRRWSNRRGNAKLVHRGQEIDEAGKVYGPIPRTRTLGFRWSAVNNLLVSSSGLGGELWRLKNGLDEDHADSDSAERYICQYIFATPYAPPQTDLVSLETKKIAARTKELGRGIVPPGAKWISVAVDVGKFLCHWAAVAWQDNATSRVVDYGVVEVHTDQFGEEHAIKLALKEACDLFTRAGWQSADGETWRTTETWIDSGYFPDAVYNFCAEYKNNSVRPIKGWGTTRDPGQGSLYPAPLKIGGSIIQIGERYHFALQDNRRTVLAHIDADYWKTFLHRRLAVPMDAPGAMTLCGGEVNEHMKIAKHITAEKCVEEFVPGKGKIARWIRERRENHWGDALYIACAAGHWAGARLIENRQPQQHIRRVSYNRAVRTSGGDVYRIGAR